MSSLADLKQLLTILLCAFAVYLGGGTLLAWIVMVIFTNTRMNQYK